MYFLFGHFGIHDGHYLHAFLCLKSVALLEPVYAIKLRRWDLEKARKAVNEKKRMTQGGPQRGPKAEVEKIKR